MQVPLDAKEVYVYGTSRVNNTTSDGMFLSRLTDYDPSSPLIGIGGCIYNPTSINNPGITISTFSWYYTTGKISLTDTTASSYTYAISFRVWYR